MINESRHNLMEYLYNLLYDRVSKNVYLLGVPTELTASDKKDGFVVIRVGSINDASEFSRQAYGWARCYVEAYIPTLSRGRYNKAKYVEWENALNEVINEKAETPDSDTYTIELDSVLNYDDDDDSNSDNRFFLFVKSFVVTINSDDDI